MTSGYVLSPLADQDLDEIVTYIHQQSPQTALRVFDDLHAAMKLLAEHPALGHHRDDLRRASFRVWCVRSFLIIYDPATKPITISRVVRGTRDLRRLFRFG